MLAARVNSPINKQNPIIIRPQMFMKSTICKVVLLPISQWKNPEKSHFDSIRYSADDQFGLANLASPS